MSDEVCVLAARMVLPGLACLFCASACALLCALVPAAILAVCLLWVLVWDAPNFLSVVCACVAFSACVLFYAPRVAACLQAARARRQPRVNPAQPARPGGNGDMTNLGP